MTFDRKTSAGYLVNHLSRIFAQGLQAEIASLGIVTGQFPALLALWERDGQTQRDLVQQLDVEQATLANTLTRMERDGLIVRKEHPLDARAKTIHLTEKAKALRAPAIAAAEKTNARLLAPLSETQQAQFLDAVHAILDGANPKRD